MPRMPRKPRSTPPGHTPPAGGEAPIDRARLEALAAAGAPDDEIAAYFGVTIDALQAYQPVIARTQLRGRTLVRRKIWEMAIVECDPSMLALLARERCGFQNSDLQRLKLQAELEEKKLRIELCRSELEERKIAWEQRQVALQLQKVELKERQRKALVAESAEAVAALDALGDDALDEHLHEVDCKLLGIEDDSRKLDETEELIQRHRQEKEAAIRSRRAELKHGTPSAGQPACQPGGGGNTEGEAKVEHSGERPS